MKNQQEIRSQNLALIRNVFERDDELVASRIAQKASLSVVTVNAILEEMCKSGEITRQGQVRFGNGRPSTLYRYNRQFSCGLVIFAYNSGDLIIVQTLVVNHFGEELKAVTGHFSEIGETEILTAIEEQTQAFPRIERLLLGLPGIEGNGVVTSGDFTAFVDTAFIGAITERFHLSVDFINDINAAVYGHNRGASAACENEVGIFFPTKFPPGAGMVLNGRLYPGDAGFAGEIASLSGKIPWSELHRYNEVEITEQLYPVLLCFICILNPAFIGLYGEYLTQGVLEQLQSRLFSELPAEAMPEIRLLRTFEIDFKNGLIAFMREKLWEDL